MNQECKDRNIDDLIAKNKELKGHLDHSRRVCRELLRKLRDERDRKRFKREDIQMIQNVLIGICKLWTSK